MHDVRGGRPSGVAISTAATGDGDIDPTLTLTQTRALAENGGRIEVVVATASVNRSCQRCWARTAIDLDFPTTPLATTDNTQVVEVKDSRLG